jgi:hypothetical protein
MVFSYMEQCDIGMNLMGLLIADLALPDAGLSLDLPETLRQFVKKT